MGVSDFFKTTAKKTNSSGLLSTKDEALKTSSVPWVEK